MKQMTETYFYLDSEYIIFQYIFLHYYRNLLYWTILHTSINASYFKTALLCSLLQSIKEIISFSQQLSIDFIRVSDIQRIMKKLNSFLLSTWYFVG